MIVRLSAIIFLGLKYYNMGSTESQGQRSRLDCEYRLIRRYISDLYAGNEVTVVEHKQTKQQYILR